MNGMDFKNCIASLVSMKWIFGLNVYSRLSEVKI